MAIHEYENGYVHIAAGPDETALIIPSPQHDMLAGGSDAIDFTRREFNLQNDELEALGERISQLEENYRQMSPSPERDKLWHILEMLKFAYLNAQRGRYLADQEAA